jgi:hypothetical protein
MCSRLEPTFRKGKLVVQGPHSAGPEMELIELKHLIIARRFQVFFRKKIAIEVREEKNRLKRISKQ